MTPQGNTRTQQGGTPQTRLIAMGSAALVEGFGLVGFETWPDADVQALDQVLSALIRSREKALIFLESDLASHDLASLQQARAQAARIIIAEIPKLRAPQAYRPSVEGLVERVLGRRVLKD